MKSPRPWTISVLSTFYDLEEHRKAIIKELQNSDITVSAFEQPDFPVEPNKHSHDSCLLALGRVDIAILIINKRSGGLYFNNPEDEENCASITEKECVEAFKRGIPIYTFVKEESWNERHSYKKQYKDFIKRHNLESGIDSKKEFDKSYKCTYVDNVSVIDFIESMQRAYPTHQVSNWIDKFTDIDDLLKKVKGKLKGYSRKLISRIAESQRNSLLHKHTSTAFGMTLGDVFDSNYYIEPPHIIESGTLDNRKSLPLSDGIYQAIRDNKSVLVCGEAGYGKTTILAKCFFKHINDYLSDLTYDIPFYLSLKNKGSDYHFDIEQLINEELANTDDTLLNHKPYPYLDLSQIRFRFYCDGFDEMAEELSPEDLDRIRQSTIFSFPLLLTCRRQFAHLYLRDPSFCDKFGIRLLIDHWSLEMAQKYINNYCNNKKEITDDISSLIINQLNSNNDLQQILDNPLLVTMFLWYIENNYSTNPKVTVAHLFKSWVEELASRERSKNASNGADIQTIVNVWSYSAWEVYLQKVEGEQSGLRFDDLNELLKKYLPNLKPYVNAPFFSMLFECSNERIIGTFHEQFMEYLAAKVLVESCVKETEPFPHFLKKVIRPEINRYFREIWLECSRKDQEKVFKALQNQYYCNIGDKDYDKVSSRVHAIYHIARLNSTLREECLETAFEKESHISVLLSLYFGAIKMGQLDKEDDFYNRLINDSKYDEANRGYHLTYYSDIRMGNELPFKDDNTSDWSGTLRAFIRHYGSNDPGHYYLWRIDLVTMRQLIDARKKVAPLTKEILQDIERSINNPPIVSNQVFNTKVLDEFHKLIEVYKSLS